MTQNNEIVNKLRSSKLRPTKQRIRIGEFLFKREKTFHFTVDKLNKIWFVIECGADLFCLLDD